VDFNTLITALVTNGIGAVCAAAVLWFAWYRETRTIPAMMKTFADSMQATQVSFEARNEKVVDAFSAVHREQQQTFAEQATAERTTCQKWHEENRHMLTQVLQETKENRHYIRDLAHVAGLRKALEEQEAKQSKRSPKDD
jgi:gas vesicle protein